MQVQCTANAPLNLPHIHPSQSIVCHLCLFCPTQSRSSTNSNPSKQTQTSLQPTCLTEKAPLLEIQIESPQHCSPPHTDADQISKVQKNFICMCHHYQTKLTFFLFAKKSSFFAVFGKYFSPNCCKFLATRRLKFTISF